MEQNIDKCVKERLVRCDLPPIDSLTEKDILRLKEIETYSRGIEIEIKNLISRAKSLEITKVSISNNINLSRRTIYNDRTLNKFIDNVIEEQKDYFNLRRIQMLEEKSSIIEERYNKILNNLIDVNVLKDSLKQYEAEVEKMLNKIKYLELKINDKNAEIRGLRQKK